MRNQSGIENWILRKARDRDYRRARPFIYPYNLGWKENLRQVFNWRETFNVIGDGLTWPIHEGTDDYALTREQLEQKHEKRQRTIRYRIIQSCKGSFITLRHGLCTCICIPCSDEPRISVEEGDYVLVTRWEKYWLYGERISADEINKKRDSKTRPRRRPRGWFPRCCVYEAFRIEDLWSGKLNPDNDMVRAELKNIAPEDDDNDEEESVTRNEENHSDDKASVSSSSSSSSSSEVIRQRKIHQDN